MNALADCDCLDQRLALVGRLVLPAQAAALRQSLEAMLRCSARLGCRQAVACSDEARQGIARLLNNSNGGA